MDVTQAEMEAFLVLADELHFGRTAERLHLSQPRVSRLVSGFETKLGGRLFDRTSRVVRLTPLGARLRVQLEPALAEIRAACGQARDDARGSTGSLRVGFTPTTEGEPLQHLVRSFAAAHPDCPVVLHEVALMNPNLALREGRVDVLANWLFVDEPDISVGPAIHYERRALAISTAHPLARRASVSVEDLAGLTFARCEPDDMPTAMLEGFLPPTTPSGKPLPRTFPLSTLGEIVAHVASGHIAQSTFAALQAKVNRADIAFVPIRDLPPIPFGLLWCTAHDNARIRAIVRHCAAQTTDRRPFPLVAWPAPMHTTHWSMPTSPLRSRSSLSDSRGHGRAHDAPAAPQPDRRAAQPASARRT